MRKFLDRLHPLFAKGGKFEKYYAVYELSLIHILTLPTIYAV